MFKKLNSMFEYTHEIPDNITLMDVNEAVYASADFPNLLDRTLTNCLGKG